MVAIKSILPIAFISALTLTGAQVVERNNQVEERQLISSLVQGLTVSDQAV